MSRYHGEMKQWAHWPCIIQRCFTEAYFTCVCLESFYNEIMNFGAMFSCKKGYMINHVRHATVLTLI